MHRLLTLLAIACATLVSGAEELVTFEFYNARLLPEGVVWQGFVQLDDGLLNTTYFHSGSIATAYVVPVPKDANRRSVGIRIISCRSELDTATHVADIYICQDETIDHIPCQLELFKGAFIETLYELR